MGLGGFEGVNFARLNGHDIAPEGGGGCIMPHETKGFVGCILSIGVAK